MDFVNKIIGKDSSSAVKITLLASVALASGYLAYSMFAGSSKSDSDILPAMTEEEAVEVMVKITDKIKVMIPKMLRAAEGIKQQITQAGQDIDDSQLMKTFILPHVKEQIEGFQKAALEEADFDDDELEEAVTYYIKEGNTDLAELVTKMKTIYKEFGGDVEVDGAEASEAAQDLTEEDVIELMEGLATKMSSSSDIYCQQFVDAFGPPSSMQGMEQFQMGLMQVADGAEKELLSERGLTQTDFQAILQQYQHSKKIQEIFMIMQHDNRRIMTKHGISMGM